jgi:hypothetical protein
MLALVLILGLVGCDFSSTEQTKQKHRQLQKGPVAITLGNTTFRLQGPVNVDGKWVDHDAKGTDLSFSIKASELYKRFDAAAADNPRLVHQRFEVYFVNVPNSDVNQRKLNNIKYMQRDRWEKPYPNKDLGLMVYEPIQQLKLGWGSPVYYPIDEKYVAPDGLPFDITCARVFSDAKPVDCRFQYFINSEISMTFNFLQVEENLRHWRELDQALRQIISSYLDTPLK